MIEPLLIKVDTQHKGNRLDKFLSELLTDLSRSTITNLIDTGAILVNSICVAKNYKLKGNEEIVVNLPEPRNYDEVIPENIPLNIVYEDNDLLVVNKPKGMVVHPAVGNYTGTLVNALMYHCKDSLSGINGVLRPGIVHRIDKNTSGLLIVAKNDVAHKGLAEQIKEHSFSRCYEAVATGHFKAMSGTIDAPIGRHSVDRKKMTVTDKNSRNAITHYNVIAEYKGYSHISCKLETGRTHQIRVHTSYLGHPIAGDTVYGGKDLSKQWFEGQCLHAKMIGFVHPITNEYMEFNSELPEYFAKFLDYLKNIS